MAFWEWILGSRPSGRDAVPGATPRSTRSAREPSVATLAPTETAEEDAGDGGEQRWWVPEGEALIDQQAPDRPELTPEALALENALISYFDGHDLNLPPMPRAAEHILQRLSDRKATMPQVARDIAEDQVIAAAVLRMANSPLYRGLTKIAALEPAVVRIGVRAVRTVVLQQSMRAATFQKNAGDPRLAELLWQRSLARGCVIRGLAELVGYNAENAFLVGLLQDIGNVIVVRVVTKHEAVTHHTIDVDTFEYLCYECHQEFGELIADWWNLPTDVKSLIADHHAYPAEDDPLRTQRLLMQLSEMICAMLGYAPSATYALLESRPARDLGLDGKQKFERYLTELPGELADTLSAL